MTLPLLSIRSEKLTKYPSCFLEATICPLYHPQYFITSPDLSFSSHSTSIKRLIKALPFGFLLLLNICLAYPVDLRHHTCLDLYAFVWPSACQVMNCRTLSRSLCKLRFHSVEVNVLHQSMKYNTTFLKGLPV